MKHTKIVPSCDQGSGLPSQKEPPSPEGVSKCWCGKTWFAEFGPDYLECKSCGTLVSQKGLSSADLRVVDDENDFYGKQYWLNHQQQDLGLPDFNARTRSDLPERNLHWLRTLLKYRLPPARVMELGCAHGSFVALMGYAGFAASGMEMSPWVVDYARDTFNIDVRKGPVEALDLDAGSLDVIAMMDVMEHLPDPVATMTTCLTLLKPDGILLIQMPNFQEEVHYDRLLETSSVFLSQLKSDEHLYLYSKRSTTEFFHRLGADYIQFEPAIFAHYDMFFVVSKMPLHRNSQEQIEGSLQLKPGGRFAMAMLDMKERYDKVPVLEGEKALHTAQMNDLYQRADEFENARNLAIAQLADLRGHFDAAEKDRADRADVIANQGHLISQLQGQVRSRNEELAGIYQRDKRSYTTLGQLQAKFAAAEEDRLEQQGLIKMQERSIRDLQDNLSATEKYVLEPAALIDMEGVAAHGLWEKVKNAQPSTGQNGDDVPTYRHRLWWKLGKLIKAI